MKHPKEHAQSFMTVLANYQPLIFYRHFSILEFPFLDISFIVESIIWSGYFSSCLILLFSIVLYDIFFSHAKLCRS